MSKLDYCFSNDYMVLRPDRASPFDLLHLLFSPKVGRNKAVDCFTSTEIRSFPRRLALFLNLLLQILLLSLAGPVVAIGAALELALNFIDNVLHGKMDWHHAALCVMASKVAYENEAFIRDVVACRWQMEFVKFYNCWNEFESAYTAQAFVFCDRAAPDAELVVVAFRGTPAFDAARWRADLDPSWHKVPRLGRAHAAYTHALGAQRNMGGPSGWSTSRASPRRCTRTTPSATPGTSTGPRSGTSGSPTPATAAAAARRAPAHFLHFGLCLHFDVSYNLKAFTEIPGETASPSAAAAGLVASRVNAARELARSAYLGYTRGAYFREGWLLMLMRVLAVALPGLPFHRAHDYVNGVALAARIPKDE
ncbi:hypothetical protein ZWY2020_024683 [Hordeum vulgare]|nr:hypothetical protein ZWY2020_024683 [Hordeum vulgare]